MLIGYGLGSAIATPEEFEAAMQAGAASRGCVPAGINYLVAPKCLDGTLMPACGAGTCGSGQFPLEPITGQAIAKYAPWVAGGLLVLWAMSSKG